VERASCADNKSLRLRQLAHSAAAIAAHFLALLWGGLLIQLLLRVRDAPGAEEIEARAHAAARALLTLYAPARAASGASR
jgi:hypothetical protein